MPPSLSDLYLFVANRFSSDYRGMQMANYSDWASEKNTPQIRKFSGEDKRAVLFFLGVTVAGVVGLVLLGSSIPYLY